MDMESVRPKLPIHVEAGLVPAAMCAFRSESTRSLVETATAPQQA
jgi:hypothetical protein